ncbi:MAG: hypothetical protein HKO59_02865 [Phycisphaerales bacterium]|nr:hypothetical protein [Phycisphaerae bacterium]NNF43111.1 hypothetical protein [Phycisphaerales bacterium]NNM24923.1 hypothetical protein [Phycisphaerales bacterium]
MRRIRRILGRHATIGRRLLPLLAWLTPAVAFAQETAPPQPSLGRYPAIWVGYLVIMVLLAIVVAVSLMPSKRGHQD